MVVAFALFLLLGLAFGFAARGAWRWLALILPLALALVTAFQDGVDGTLVLRLAVALLVTAGGVVLGMVLSRDEAPRRAEPGWR